MTAVSRNGLVQSALEYAERGWAVIPIHTWRNDACSCRHRPCNHPAKHPRTTHGLKDASTDPATIHDWWSRWPDANLAIATGSVSGLIVLDIDLRHGGEASLAKWESEHGPLPASLTSLTGGGGRHVFFSHPGFPVKNRVGLAAGIDVRGDGGYVVAPPSRHKSGGVYAFVNPSTLIMPMPEELIAALVPAAPMPRSRGPLSPFQGTLTPYAEAALDRECAELAGWPKGTVRGRHGQIFKVAAQLGELVAGGALPRPLVVVHVLDAARVCGAVADYGEKHVLQQIEDGLLAGDKKPRSLPDDSSIRWAARPPVTGWARRPEVTTWKR